MVGDASEAVPPGEAVGSNVGGLVGLEGGPGNGAAGAAGADGARSCVGALGFMRPLMCWAKSLMVSGGPSLAI